MPGTGIVRPMSGNGAVPSAVGTRQRILEVALRRFAAAGYQATSVRELADDVGVTQPALYYHFGSKDGILAALVEPFLDDGERVIERLERRRATRAVLVREALEGYYDVLVAHLEVARFVEADRAVRSHPGAGHRLAAQAARLMDLVAGSDRPERRVRAAAALGAVRRPLRLPEFDPVAHRAIVVAAALAAASPGRRPPR